MVDNISDRLLDILPHVRVYKNTIIGSSILDKSGRPIVRIDSKVPIKALMLKVNEDSIEIKSIVNSTNERGFSNDILKIILNLDYRNFIIDSDVSNGFWDRVIESNPEYNWSKI